MATQHDRREIRHENKDGGITPSTSKLLAPTEKFLSEILNPVTGNRLPGPGYRKILKKLTVYESEAPASSEPEAPGKVLFY